MREFNRTILIKWDKTWQPADASITEFPDGTDEIYFKLNGRVYYLAPGQKDWQYKKINESYSTETAYEYAIDMNKWELDCILDMEKKKEADARNYRLNQYRVGQAVRNARANP